MKTKLTLFATVLAAALFFGCVATTEYFVEDQKPASKQKDNQTEKPSQPLKIDGGNAKMHFHPVASFKGHDHI